MAVDAALCVKYLIQVEWKDFGRSLSEGAGDTKYDLFSPSAPPLVPGVPGLEKNPFVIVPPILVTLINFYFCNPCFPCSEIIRGVPLGNLGPTSLNNLFPVLLFGWKKHLVGGWGWGGGFLEKILFLAQRESSPEVECKTKLKTQLERRP